jgi:hypothetical protein
VATVFKVTIVLNSLEVTALPQNVHTSVLGVSLKDLTGVPLRLMELPQSLLIGMPPPNKNIFYFYDTKALNLRFNLWCEVGSPLRHNKNI